jgi:hypothetical protein
MINTAWIVYIRQTDRNYLSQPWKLYAKAEAIAPNNPRIFSKAEFEIGGEILGTRHKADVCSN